jgi:hypothetical protein
MQRLFRHWTLPEQANRVHIFTWHLFHYFFANLSLRCGRQNCTEQVDSETLHSDCCVVGHERSGSKQHPLDFGLLGCDAM